MKTLSFISVLVTAAFAVSSAKADLIVNGSFEIGNPPLNITATQLQSDGWTVANLEYPFSGVVQGSTYLGSISPHSGNYYFSLSDDYNAGLLPNGQQWAGISQTIVTTPGQVYTLSFFAYLETAENYDRPPGLHFEALWDNRTLTSVQDPPVVPRGWVQYSFVVPGTGSDTVTFYGANVPFFNGLDDVSLVNGGVLLPLPGNLTMCGIASVIGLFGCGWRRRFPIPA